MKTKALLFVSLLSCQFIGVPSPRAEMFEEPFGEKANTRHEKEIRRMSALSGMQGLRQTVGGGTQAFEKGNAPPSAAVLASPAPTPPPSRPAPYAKPGWTGMEVTNSGARHLPEAWRERLAAFDSSKELASFLGTRSVPVFVVPAGYNARLGWYENGRIFINRDWLNSRLERCRRRSATYADAYDLLVTVTLPVFAHEASHALNDAEVTRVTGLQKLGSWLEDETLSYAKEAQLQAEIIARLPETKWIMHQGPDDNPLAKAWGEGLAGIENYARSFNPRKRSILHLTNADILKTHDEFAARLRRWCDDVQCLARKTHDAERGVRREAEKVMNLLAEHGISEASAKQELAELEELQRLLEHGRLDKLRSYYRERYVALQKEWEASRKIQADSQRPH